MTRDADGPVALRAWHVAPLAALAISWPVADVLARAPEFFVAHRLDRVGTVGLTAALFAGLPLAVWGFAAIGARVFGLRTILVGLIAGLIALLGLQASNHAGAPPPIAVPLVLVVALVSAWSYQRWPAVRQFAVALAPAPVVLAVIFLTRAPVRHMLSMHQGRPAGQVAKTSTPVVMIVFDQLPLLSLIDEQRQIDRRRFPNFASLADEATWYRNTTAAAEATNWALPALLTGQRPEPRRLPTAFDHPNSLFTLLAPSHQLHVVEPVTALCPSDLCRPGQGARGSWRTIASDLLIVYGHIVLPTTLAARLPPVNQDWAGFGGDFWQHRWSLRRDADRRQVVLDWIEGIQPADGAALHFLHVLLPHEPYVYLPSGQRGTAAMSPAGLDPNEWWRDDEQLVALAYTQHLMQLQFVDHLLGLTLARLREAGLYDKSLIAVVADHGAAFRAGRPFKQIVPSTVAEIAFIPFFLKAPDQRHGTIVDTPIEAVDVLPTICDVLAIDAGWRMDGHPASETASHDERRPVYRDGARRPLVYSATDFARGWDEAIDRKRRTVDSNSARLTPPEDPHRGIVDRPVASFHVIATARLKAQVDDASAFHAIDTDGAFVPVYVSGAAQRVDGSSAARVPLAVAVNGIIRATTTVSRRAVAGRAGFWAALIPPAAYKSGANEVEIFEITERDGRPTLRPCALDGLTNDAPNLLETDVQLLWGIDVNGVYAPEREGPDTFWWTNGRADLHIPTPPAPSARSLELTVRGGDPEQRLEIRANECVLFSGRQAAERVTHHLDLSRCPVNGSDRTLSIVSGTFVPEGGDTRHLGVALEAIRLK